VLFKKALLRVRNSGGMACKKGLFLARFLNPSDVWLVRGGCPRPRGDIHQPYRCSDWVQGYPRGKERYLARGPEGGKSSLRLQLPESLATSLQCTAKGKRPRVLSPDGSLEDEWRRGERQERYFTRRHSYQGSGESEALEGRTRNGQQEHQGWELPTGGLLFFL